MTTKMFLGCFNTLYCTLFVWGWGIDCFTIFTDNNMKSPGLKINEIGIGDVIQCGDEYRIVQRLIYMNAATSHGRKYYRSIQTSGSMRDTTPGRPWYRITIAKEIRTALLKLPYSRMKDITVEGIYKTGRRLSADVNT